MTKSETKRGSGSFVTCSQQIVLGVVAILMLFAAPAYSADLNVLIVGTTYDTGEFGTNTYGTSKAFDVSKVRTELESILGAAGMGSVQVSLHDYRSNSSSSGTGNKLIEEFLNPDSSYAPTAEDFWANLRGESGTDWDYVILMGEPYTLEYFPGLYTLGVSEVGKEVAKGNGETVLLMGWPADGSDSTVDHYKEVVYRTGRSLGYKVVPAGLAWKNQGSVRGTSHPTDDGAFLTAAAIYSRVWGVENGQDRSVSEFTNNNDVLADAVHNAVKTNKGAVQYTGKFTHPSDVFTMLNDSRREWIMGSKASSTENTLRTHEVEVGRYAGMDISSGQDTEFGPKGMFIHRYGDFRNDHTMNSGYWYPGCCGNYYSSDNYVGLIASDLGDKLRASRSTLANCPTYRHLPQPALWGMVRKVLPSTPFTEFQHGGRGWGWSTGAYMLTIKTGRCPMIPDLSEPTVESNAAQIGYETAWRMTTLQGRAPGFQVLPSDYERHTLDPVAPETMTVRFMFSPRENVTVNVSTDVAWATVTPQVLTFTPENHNTPQEITVTLVAEAANLRGEIFNVSYSTNSADEVCDALADSWEYKVNTLPVAEPANLQTLANQSLNIRLTSTDPDVYSKVLYLKGKENPKQNMVYSIVEGPANGELVINADTAVYTPNPGFVGVDSFTFQVFDGFAYCEEAARVDISVLAKGQYDLNLIINPGAEFFDEAAGNQPVSWNGEWASLFNTLGNIVVPSAHEGQHSFRAGTSAATVELYQDVDISDYSAAINAGLQSFHYSGWGNDKARDDGRLALEFKDINGQVLGTSYESERVNSDSWKLVEATLQAPPNAVVARVILRGMSLVDDKNLCHFDTLSLEAIRPPNRAPTAVDPLQASVAMNVPTVIPLVATDPDMHPADTLSYEIVDGPDSTKGQLTGWQDGMPIYTPNQGFLGTDSFTFRVFDGQVYSANTATASIRVRDNVKPSITVHTPVMPVDTNKIYMAATNGLIFETTISDDGGPYPSNLTIQWQQTAGPVTAVFGSPNSEVTTCNWGDGNDGTYEFEVTASDGQYETVQKFIITVLNGGYDIEPNVAPQVDVGGPYGTVSLSQPYTLEGSSLFDDGEPLDPGVTTLEWLQVSGPGTASFSTPDKYGTDVVFDAGGTYVLRLTGDDGQIKSYEDLTLEVVGPTPPVVRAGKNQTVTMSGEAATVTPDPYFEYDAAENPGAGKWASTTSHAYDWTIPSTLSAVDISGSRFFTLTEAYEFPAAKSSGSSLENHINESASGSWEFVLDADSDDGLIMESGGTGDGVQFWIEGGFLKGHVRNGTPKSTVSYELSDEDKSRFIHVLYVINNEAGTFTLYVDGLERDSQEWTGTDWCGSNNAGLGAVGSDSPTGFTGDFTGEIALIRFYENKALSPQEAADNFNSLAPGALVDLAGEVIEGAIASPAITWSVFDGDASKVSFENANSAVTSAIFAASGEYTLRLTADDGLYQISDYVTIKVFDSESSAYSNWVSTTTFAKPFTDTAMTSNPDGDRRNNLLEFAFGTDPTRMDMGPLAKDGSQHGDPVASVSSEGRFELYYLRRKDGSLKYTACFSDDLAGFYDNDDELNPPELVVEFAANPEYEIVKVSFPTSLDNGQPARFGRVRVEVP